MSSKKISWDLICLVCLREPEDDDQMYSIHNEEKDNGTILDKILSCLNMDESKDWNIPEQICSNCLIDLTVAYRFHMKCKIAFNVFKPDDQKASNEIKLKGQHFYKIPTGLKIKKVTIRANLLAKTKDKDETNMESSSFDDPISEYALDEHDDEDTNESEDLKSEDYIENTMETIHNSELDENHDSMEYEMLNPDDMENINSPEKSNEDTSNDALEIVEPKKKIRNEIPLEIKKIKKKYTKRINGQKPPKMCEICGNSYKYQHALDSHMRRHRNEKPFECEFCDKSFVANVELRRHMRVHTGQKPYGCQYCDRSFSDFGSRIKHERTHTGERPYECKTCGKAFAYAHVLSVHNLTHTGEKKYKCSMCSKGFTKKSYLVSHESNKSCKGTNKLYDGCNNSMKHFLDDINTSSDLYDNIIIEEPSFGDVNDDNIIVSENFESVDYVI